MRLTLRGIEGRPRASKELVSKAEELLDLDSENVHGVELLEPLPEETFRTHGPFAKDACLEGWLSDLVDFPRDMAVLGFSTRASAAYDTTKMYVYNDISKNDSTHIVKGSQGFMTVDQGIVSGSSNMDTMEACTFERPSTGIVRRRQNFD
ncbi:unnamed protein product [Symbiodinium microadriaticum]|nr:unnamed protein product [Symbiodinium microadriaticum]CAE7859675.1 unnamed protein product [Symbiodinium sp. KB8]